jgi:hypothetical protein
LANQYRTIRLFSLHAHQREERFDYLDFFKKLGAIPKEQRTIAINRDLYLYLHTSTVNGSEIHLQVAGGHPDNMPTVIDSKSGNVFQANLPEDNWIGHISQIIIEITDQGRVCAIENRRNGVTPTNMETFLIRLYEEYYHIKIDLSFSPIADVNFLEQIDSMKRIRQVTLVMSQPNPTWDDHFNYLSRLAKESKAQKFSTTITAPRGGSLSSEEGIVPVVKEQSTSPDANLEKVTVKGTREKEARETTVSLDKNIRKSEVSIPKNATLTQMQEIITNAARSFIGAYIKNK